MVFLSSCSFRKTSFSASEEPDIGENCTGRSLPVTEIDGAPRVPLSGVVEGHQQLKYVFSRRVAHVSAGVLVLRAVTSVLTLPRIASVVPGAFPWHLHGGIVVVFCPVADVVLHVEQWRLVRGPGLVVAYQLLQV